MSSSNGPNVFALTPEWFEIFDKAGLVDNAQSEIDLPNLTGSKASIVIVDGIDNNIAITKSLLLALQQVAPEGIDVAIDLNALDKDDAEMILAEMKTIMREMHDAPVVSQDESRIVEEYEALRQSGGHLGISEPAYVTLPSEAPIFDMPAWQQMNQHPTGMKKGKKRKNRRKGFRK